MTHIEKPDSIDNKLLHSLLRGRGHVVILSPLPLSPAQAQKMRISGSKLATTDNVIDQPETQNSRDQVADDAKGRETEEQGFHPGGDDH